MRIVDCDAPGVMCDSFGLDGPASDPKIKTGALLIRRGCGADLEAGTPTCGDEKKVDFLFESGEGAALWVRPVNGASITPVDTPHAPYSDRPFRIDGGDTGSDFWVRTASGHVYSHLILTADVDADSRELSLHFANRAR